MLEDSESKGHVPCPLKSMCPQFWHRGPESASTGKPLPRIGRGSETRRENVGLEDQFRHPVPRAQSQTLSTQLD